MLLLAHPLQVLAQYWHLSAAHYWQLRLVCAIVVAPLLGILCLILFHKREEAGSKVVRVTRHIRVLARRDPATYLPLQHTASQP